MRVLVNHLTALRHKTGIGHYVTELVRCLREQHPDDTFLAYPGRWSSAVLGQAARLRKLLARRAPAAQPSGARSTLAWLPELARRAAGGHFRLSSFGQAFDLYHEPNYIPFACARPTVATVHDLSVVLHPHWHPADRVAYFDKYFEPGLRRCSHLLTVSEFTRLELITTFNVPPAQVTCVYNGIRADLRPLPAEEVRPVLERLGLTTPYLLHVGTLEPRKNLLLLLQAYSDLPSGIRVRCPLVLAGGWGWNAAQLADYYQHTARPRGVRLLGYVADADLPALYNGARALVYPSHYEGFGLPPLEMLACGGAVLASTAAAVAETTGPCAHLIDADDFVAWRDALQRLIVDDDWHGRLRHGGPLWARSFTWQRCARQTYRVYAAALGQTVSAAQAA